MEGEIIIEHWSHGAERWEYYLKFETEESYRKHLRSHGYDEKYFRIAKHKGE